jgi:hypothetical protein
MIGVATFCKVIFGQVEPLETTTSSPSALASSLKVTAGNLEASAVRFIPPLPPEPLPFVPVKVTTEVRHMTHTLTLARGEPSTLPDLPTQAETGARNHLRSSFIHIPRYYLGLSATVYDGELSRVSWQDPETKEQLEVWCGWDWTTLGPMTQIESESVHYTILCFPSRINTTRHDSAPLKRRIPDHPTVAPNQFVFTICPADSKTGNYLMEAIQNYYFTNHTRLIAMAAARRKYQADA